MKYPQLVSERAVSTISEWLVTRLEVLGVEAPIVYSRLLLSLLHTPLQVDSVDLADIPQLKNCLGKRFNSRRLSRSDAERLKRGAAIESLMEVVEVNEKRSKIVDLVTELCGKLRDLERSEEDQYDQQQQQQQQMQETEEATSRGARNKEAKAKSNPYYQMFPALSGGAGGGSAGGAGGGQQSSGVGSSRGGIAVGESSASAGNWGQQQQQQWKREGGAQPQGERMSNGSSTSSVQELQSLDKGNNKRKNKKRRTNGPSSSSSSSTASASVADKRMASPSSTVAVQQWPKFNNTPATVAHQPQQQQLNAVRGKKHLPGKIVEWDTNFSGQWEMADRDPIKEFLTAQRNVDNDCESVATTTTTTSATDDANYDNVFKMRRSDVNEEQTMLIKSFLTQRKPEEEAPKAKPELGFGFDAAEEYFNFISSEDHPQPLSQSSPRVLDEGRRLFEREVSAESLVAMNHASNGVTLVEEPTTEFDANLDAFKAKFNRNIRNLWNEEDAENSVVVMEQEEMNQNQAQQQMSVNSFWQNYNKHLYEFQESGQSTVNNSMDLSGGGGGGWEGPQQQQSLGNVHLNMMLLNEQQLHHHQQNNVFPSSGSSCSSVNGGKAANPSAIAAIWSNHNNIGGCEFEDPQQSSLLLQQYNEQMAAAYKKRLEFGGGGEMDLFGGGCGPNANLWPNEVGSGFTDMEYQMYYGAQGGGSLLDEMMIDGNNNLGGDVHQGLDLSNMKLEQSMAAINHSSTSSFAKVDRRVMGGGGGGGIRASGVSLMGVGAGNASGRGSGASAITNMSSLYGSFKQNSMENLLTSERTHFKPIKQAYLDGHTFDIPCSPDTIDYVRSQSGSLFFELDKYMEYTVVAHQDDYDLDQRSTNVPISRCGTIVPDHEAEADGYLDAMERQRNPGMELVKQQRQREREQKAKKASAGRGRKFTLRFCVRQQNEKSCQTEVMDYSSGSATAAAKEKKYPNNVFPNVRTCHVDTSSSESTSGGCRDAAATTTMKAEAEIKWNHESMSLLWQDADQNTSGSESFGTSNNVSSNNYCNSVESSLNYESLPANRLLRDELSADAEEILKDSLTYMQNLYIDDDEEEDAEEECGDRDTQQQQQESDPDEMERDQKRLSYENERNAMDLANYYEMGQLISEILNPKQQRQVEKEAEEDLLWYKNWPQYRNWLPILDQSAVVASLCKAKNVWNYGGSNNVMNNNNSSNEDRNNNNNGDEVDGRDEWKFSNLRTLWNDVKQGKENGKEDVALAEVEDEEGDEGNEGVEEEEEEEVASGLLLGEDEEKNYHLIIFEKSAKGEVKRGGGQGDLAKGRKRRHSASQNLYDDLEWLNGGDAKMVGGGAVPEKWLDYCCRCDCGKRSEKILKYRNKLLMKRVDKLGYVHNASVLLQDFSRQFDSIDEILNEGLICGAALAGGEGQTLCEYEGEKLCSNMDQVSMLKNPNLYLNRTALISMARPLTR